MISHELSMIKMNDPRRAELAENIEAFLAAGGRIAELKSPPRNPLPPARSTKIDPDTVLKRKPRVLTRAERQALRKMADAL